MKTIKYLFFVVLFLGAVSAQAQDYEIDQYDGQTVSTCGGIFYDSGGPIGNHGTAESYSVTFCPSTPGTSIQLDFTTWNCGAGSSLQVFDGPDNTYNSFGTYSPGGFNPMTTGISASPANVSGCLTLEWTSGGTGAQGWAAVLSCVVPCQTVLANLIYSNPPINAEGFIDICLGDPIQLFGSGVFPQNNLVYGQSNSSSTFIWDFGNSTQDSSGNSVNVVYTEISGYNINLTVIDSMGCESTNVLDARVRISTQPDFAGTIPQDSVICAGDEVTLFGEVEMTPYELSADLALAGTTFLPDGSGASYSTSLTFNAFAPGQVLTDVNDILGICAQMEHSYLGDLDIWIECPNGSIVNFLVYPNGGGGTYLGEPIDIDLNLNPGVGYNYCWSPNPTYGTMSAESANYTTLPAGSYAAEDPWSNFLGCPLNGTWTIGITDNLLSDNGFIFEWGINFDPAILPINFNYEPIVETQTWTNTTGILVLDQDSDVVIAPPAGSYNYTYGIVDDFGCSYDTTISLLVHPTYIVDFPEDTTLCSNASILLDATRNGLNNGALYAWHWDFYGTDTISTDGQFLVTKPGMYSVSIPNIVNECGHTDSIYVTYNDMELNLGLDVSSVCSNTPVTLDATTPPETYIGGVSYSWSTGGFSPTLTAYQSGTYTVTVSRGDCIEVDEVHVDYDEFVNVDLGDEAFLCAGSTLVLTTGYEDETYVWSTGSISDTIEVNMPGTYGVTVSNACGVSSDWVDVISFDVPLFSLGMDQYICDGTATVLSSDYVSPGPEPTYLWSTGETQGLISASTQGIYSLTITNDCGAYQDQLYLEIEYPLDINLGSDTTICLGETLTLDPAVNGTGYSWSTGESTSTIEVNTTGSYEVEVENSCGVYSDYLEILVLDYQVNLGADTSICPGTSYTIAPQNLETSYLWNDGTTASSILIDQAGVYAVTATNIYQCSAIDTVEVGVFNLDMNLGPDTTICDGDNYLLESGHPGFTYEWSTGANTEDISVLTSDIYSVTVHHICGDLSDEIDITVFESLIVDLGADTIIIEQGGTVDLDAGNPGEVFYWSTGETTQLINVSEGTYTVTVTGSNGCETTATVVVEFRVGINSVQASTNVYNLYPNPANNHFRIESQEEIIASVQLFNSIGQQVAFFNVDALSAQFDANELAEGYYFVKVINSKNEESTLRLAVMK